MLGRGLGVAAALALACCAPNVQVRTELRPCAAGTCERSALEIHDDPAAPFALGFVEFDDQGRAFDPRQERLLFDDMAEQALVRHKPLAIITFVHGWQHNARASDGNVQQFRQLLTAVASYEAQLPADRRRAVIGVYAGWRGLSIDASVANTLSFWTRKDAAHRVADGSIRSLLGKLRAFRDLVNLRQDANGQQPRRESRMLTIGHSFGGLIVYSALAQYWTDRAASSMIQARYFAGAGATDHANEKADPREISSYGDLVVVVNPAYEAIRYEPVRQLLDEAQTGPMPARFAPRQSPVLVQVTSVGDSKFEGDWATGVAFPIGRRFNTFMQSTRVDPATGDNERQLIEQAVGHYTPYWTHDLDREGPEQPNTAQIYNQASACRSFREFELTARGADGRLKRGWQRRYLSGAVLKEIGGGRYDPGSPFWMVRAHPSIILDHNDILGPVFVDFVAQLYGDIDRLKFPSLCDNVR